DLEVFMRIYDHTAKNAKGVEVSLSNYKGKVRVVVSTASQCRCPNQDAGLQKVYLQYHEKGLEVLASPCNQCGAQEPGDIQEITSFCETRVNTNFPIFEKVEVNGTKAHPLFQYLTHKKPGILGSKNIKWNFTKFLVD